MREIICWHRSMEAAHAWTGELSGQLERGEKVRNGKKRPVSPQSSSSSKNAAKFSTVGISDTCSRPDSIKDGTMEVSTDCSGPEKGEESQKNPKRVAIFQKDLKNTPIKNGQTKVGGAYFPSCQRGLSAGAREGGLFNLFSQVSKKSAPCGTGEGGEAGGGRKTFERGGEKTGSCRQGKENGVKGKEDHQASIIIWGTALPYWWTKALQKKLSNALPASV